MPKPTNPKKSVVVFIRVTPQEKKRLKEMAAHHHMSEAAIIRSALAYYVPVTRSEATRGEVMSEHVLIVSDVSTRPMEMTRSIQQIQLGEVPRGAAVEFRIKQKVDEMVYSTYSDRLGYQSHLEVDAVRSLCREIARQGFVTARSETDFRDRVNVTTYSIRVVRP